VAVSTEELAREYGSALESYLRTGAEAALQQAYEFGRTANASGLGVLEVAAVQYEALAEVLRGAADLQECARKAQQASAFFAECLSPFEMTHRGFREANLRLQELNAALERRAREVELLNRELEAFSYSVSHDLRAPLRAIDGFSQALLEDYASKLDAEGQGYLQRVRAASQRMAQLIDDLLNLSRITRAEMSRDDVNLTAMAQEVAEELRKAEPGREADVIIAPGLRASGDARLLRVVLANLLGNAWKFTRNKPRARIEFGRARRGNETAYFVGDDGVGFDMEYVDKLFGAFQRLHSAGEFEGTGIGLATVQRIIHRHGGRVWAEGAVEQGATFYFTLP
jgi:light-regulated signal transduction histidine kinase (bacteriophytochrome)